MWCTTVAVPYSLRITALPNTQDHAGECPATIWFFRFCWEYFRAFEVRVLQVQLKILKIGA